jgi:hypothetical protein
MFGISRIFIESTRSTLVLQRFTILQEPEDRSLIVFYISGRKGGIIPFILTLFGIMSRYELMLNRQELRYKVTTLFSLSLQSIPVSSIACVLAGMGLPIVYLFLAVIMLFIGFYMGLKFESHILLSIFFVFSIIFIILFVIKKYFYIEIHPQAGPPVILLFRPSVIEGVSFDQNKVFSIVALIRDIVNLAQARAPAGDHEVASTGAPEGLGNYQVMQEYTQQTAVSYEGLTPAQDPSVNPFAWDSYQQQAAYPTYETTYPTYAAQPATGGETEEQVAERLLAEARAFSQAKRRQEALDRLLIIVQHYPQTSAAERARQILQKAGIQI